MRLRHLLPLLCLAASAQATTLEKLEVPELTARAQLIVRARVTRVASKWTPDGRTLITVADLEILETLKGKSHAAVTVSSRGGELGDVGQYVAGSPRFVLGQEVLVFLYEQVAPVHGVVGWAQGLYQVQRTRTGAWTVPTSTADATLIDPRTGAAVFGLSAATTWDAMKGQISKAMR